MNKTVALPRLALPDEAPRHSIGDGATRVTARFVEGASGGGRVTHLSPLELWLVPDAAAGLFEGRRVQLVLEHDGSGLGLADGAGGRGDLRLRLSGEITFLRLSHDPRVVVRLGNVPLEAGRRILELTRRLVERGAAAVARRPQVTELIADDRRIGALLGALCAGGAPGVLRARGQVLAVTLAEVDPATPYLRWRVNGLPAAAAFLDGPCDIELAGFHSAYRLRVAYAQADEGELVTPLPRTVQRVRQRYYRRAAPHGPLRLRFAHPLWSTLPTAEREVVDVSVRGLTVALDRDEDLLFPGLELPYAELVTDEGELVCLRAEVRHLLPTGDGSRWLCGLEVTPLPFEHSLDWHRLTARVLHPHTRTSDGYADSLWSLFAESGYFSLAAHTPEHFADLKASFADMTRRMARTPQLVCQTVWPSSRGAEATISCLKAYQHAWMGHQVAKRPGRPPVGDPSQILRDIYLRIFEHPQHDPDFRWMVGYVETTVPWMARAHHEFALRHQDSGLALAMPVRMMTAHVDEPSVRGGGYASGLDFGLASDEEKQLLCTLVAETRPAAYVDSLDLVPARLELGGVSQAWQQHGLGRSRAILVARRGRQPLAAAVMELGPLGTNLFCLLDSVRLVPLHADGRSVYVELLDEVREHYRAWGRRSFLYLCEDDAPDYVAAARLHDEGDACRPYFWALAAQLVPDFLEHVCELTAGRRLRGSSTSSSASAQGKLEGSRPSTSPAAQGKLERNSQ